jgi:hypothetical protein
MDTAGIREFTTGLDAARTEADLDRLRDALHRCLDAHPDDRAASEFDWTVYMQRQAMQARAARRLRERSA